MSWLGNCTRCGKSTPSTKDARFWPAETTTGEESARLFGREIHTSYGPDGKSFGVHHRECDDLPEQYWPSGNRVTDPPVLPASASPIEKLFWAAHQQLALPELAGLVPQHPAGRYRIDFALPERRTGIELDGHATHSSPAAIARDRQRQRDLERTGWRIIRFGGSEVHRDAAGCVRQAASLARQYQEGGSQ